VSAVDQTDLTPMARLLRDINSSETLLDLVALRLRRASGVTIPGYEKPKHWFDSNTNGFADEAPL
jgi:hypothetical protein